MSAEVNASHRKGIPLRALEIPKFQSNGQDMVNGTRMEGEEGYAEGICHLKIVSGYSSS